MAREGGVITTTVDQAGIPDLSAITSVAAQASLLNDIAYGAYAKWTKLARDNLVSTRAAYIDGLQYTGRKAADGVSLEAVITLNGELANEIEQGAESYDMHDTLLGPDVPVVPRGQRGKHNKKGGGFYRVIPFRHQGPDTNGIHGAPMGSSYGESLGHDEAYKLGKAIYAEAKKLKATVGMPGGKVKYGGRLPAGLAPKLKEHHHSDIYAGMIKQSKTYAKATQSQYATFRTISTGSPGWVRKATEGKHFCEEVQRFTEDRLIPGAIKAFLRGAAGDAK
jgi:hypothetical protein